MMCKPHNAECFSDDEKVKLKGMGWSDEQVVFAEDSVVEERIKEMIK